MTGEMQNLAPAGPCVLVIFGASGDLTKRLLISRDLPFETRGAAA